MSDLDDLVEFQDTVFYWVQLGGARSLAEEFECAVSTPDRWCRGTARPHPLLQKQIIEWIRGRVA